MDRRALEVLNYGMFIAAVENNGKMNGCLINSLAQVTSGLAPRFTITLNKKNETYKAMRAKGSVAISVLKEDTDLELVKMFGYKTGRLIDKLANVPHDVDEQGNPYLTKDAVAEMSFKLVQEVDLGTYRRFGPSSTNEKYDPKLDLGSYALFIADLVDSRMLGSGPILTLDKFNESGAEIPADATAYRPTVVQGLTCKICGYKYPGEKLPEGFVCPVCGADESEFEK